MQKTKVAGIQNLDTCRPWQSNRDHWCKYSMRTRQ